MFSLWKYEFFETCESLIQWLLIKKRSLVRIDRTDEVRCNSLDPDKVGVIELIIMLEMVLILHSHIKSTEHIICVSKVNRSYSNFDRSNHNVKLLHFWYELKSHHKAYNQIKLIDYYIHFWKLFAIIWCIFILYYSL